MKRSEAARLLDQIRVAAARGDSAAEFTKILHRHGVPPLHRCNSGAHENVASVQGQHHMGDGLRALGREWVQKTEMRAALVKAIGSENDAGARLARGDR